MVPSTVLTTAPALSSATPALNERSDNVGVTRQRANALYAWLTSLNDVELPGLIAIAVAAPGAGTPKQVFEAFATLARQGRIDQRHGTPGRAKGHRIVLILATGAVLKTPGCPLTFDSTPNRRGHRVGAATIWRVFEIVERCATEHLYMPRTDHFGQRVGRSPDTVRRALCALHDEGRIVLVQRGTRRVAELPDGRATL
jgi:hypothetical protein